MSALRSAGFPACGFRGHSCPHFQELRPHPLLITPPSLHGEQANPLGFPLRIARYFLSLGERIKVRGNGSNDLLAYPARNGSERPPLSILLPPVMIPKLAVSAATLAGNSWN